jgi:hypothetical protein
VGAVGEIDRLIADLESRDAVRRGAAVARLRILGARAQPRVAAFIDSNHSPAARALALSALEGVETTRVVKVALACLGSPEVDLVVAALGVLRGCLEGRHGTEVLEAVTALAVDHRRGIRERTAAFDALRDLPERLLEPIRQQMPPPEHAGRTLDEPEAACRWVEAYAQSSSLSMLHDLVSRFREREERESTARARRLWRRARGLAHRALAARGSRIALYDLRETFAAADEPLPPGFLEAIATVGDASCLEPLARAWSAAGPPWRGQLQQEARRLVRRARLTARSAVIKRVQTNWPRFL